MSGSDFLGVQCSFSLIRIAGVISSLIFVACLYACALWFPDCTRCSLGIEEYSRGSGKPIVIYMYLVAAVYTFTVRGDNF